MSVTYLKLDGLVEEYKQYQRAARGLGDRTLLGYEPVELQIRNCHTVFRSCRQRRKRAFELCGALATPRRMQTLS